MRQERRGPHALFVRHHAAAEQKNEQRDGQQPSEKDGDSHPARHPVPGGNPHDSFIFSLFLCFSW
jgi:hypothetical protein